jgi:hypothetical protein
MVTTVLFSRHRMFLKILRHKAAGYLKPNHQHIPTKYHTINMSQALKCRLAKLSFEKADNHLEISEESGDKEDPEKSAMK